MDFGGESFSTYPTSFGLFNTGGSGQIGDYSDPKADSLINASITSTDPAAVVNELSYLNTSEPVLWQPLRDHVYVWKTNVSATTPKAFENLTQYDPTPEFWYTTK
jgi:peptide/nickel transport system substrate-binding protein